MMTEKQTAKREKTRNIGEEILQGIRDLKAGRAGAASLSIRMR